MHLFTDNQVTHFYHATEDATGSSFSATKGGIQVKYDNEYMWLLYNSTSGGVQRSDLIKKDNIISVATTKAAAMDRKARKTTITIGSSASDTLVAGQTYIVNLRFDHYQGMSDEDITYKVGSYLATSNTATTADAATAIANELKANLGISTNGTVNSLDRDLVTITVGTSSSANVITITEKFQPWHLGTMQVVPVYFSASVAPIVSGGIETTAWATVANDLEDSGTTLVNSKDIADMEYFYLGERGDQYRLNGFPNYIHTDYTVNPDNAFGYDVIQIHYYYVGSNEQAQKSEKDLIIVCAAPTSGSPAARKTSYAATDLVNKVINHLETATGLTIADL